MVHRVVVLVGRDGVVTAQVNTGEVSLLEDARGLIYRPGPLTQIKAEIRRLQFLDFIHQGGNLDCAVAVLLVLAKGRTRADLPMYLPEFRTETLRMLNFLCDQQLV